MSTANTATTWRDLAEALGGWPAYLVGAADELDRLQ